MSHSSGWIGVDLDATLARYDGWVAPDHIGEPVPAMVERVRGWIAEGREVRVLTARVCSAQSPADRALARAAIEAWTMRHVGVALVATSEKDYRMIELWDDRAVTVEANTGACRTEGR